MTERFSLDSFNVGLMDEAQISKLELPEGACIDCQDVVWTPAGALTKRKGLNKMHTSAWKASAITKVGQWKSSTGASYSFVFSAYASTAVTASIATVATTAEAAEFTEITDPTSAWSPSTIEPISLTSMVGSAAMTFWGNIEKIYGWAEGASGIFNYTDSPSGAKVVVGFGNYLFACNVLDEAGTTRLRSRIQWCTSRNPDSWPASYFMDLDAEDGDEICAAVVFKNKLVVFKRFKTYIIYWVGGQLLFTSELINNSVGCLGPNAWMESGGSLYFIGEYGLYKFDGSSTPESIADTIQSTVNSMNISVGQTFDVDSDEENWQIWFNVATGASTTKNVIWCYDTKSKSFTKFNIAAACIGGIDFGTNLQYMHLPGSYSTYSFRIREAMGCQSGILCVGTYDGFLAQYGLENNDYGNPISGYWVSRWLDFGDPTINKRIIRVTVLLERSGTYDLNFYLYKDWDSETPAVIETVSLVGGLDVGLIEKRIDFTCPIRVCQIKVSTAESDTPFIIHRIVVEYIVKGRTLV